MYWIICFFITLGILLVVHWICTRNHIDDVEDRLNRRLLELKAYVDGLDNLNRHRLNNLEPLVMRLKKELEDMKNIEKYLWVADDYREDNPMCRLCRLRDEYCSHYIACKDCLRETLKWLNKEYEEPQKHYTEIEVMNGDGLTPGQDVLASDHKGEHWYPMKFLFYDSIYYCVSPLGGEIKAFNRCKIVKEV